MAAPLEAAPAEEVDENQDRWWALKSPIITVSEEPWSKRSEKSGEYWAGQELTGGT